MDQVVCAPGGTELDCINKAALVSLHSGESNTSEVFGLEPHNPGDSESEHCSRSLLPTPATHLIQVPLFVVLSEGHVAG